GSATSSRAWATPATRSSERSEPLRFATSEGATMRTLAWAALAVLLLTSCTQERQNQIKRDIQNWTGTNGVLEVYAGDKLVRRFLKIDKMSTAYGTDDKLPRPYRFGY